MGQTVAEENAELITLAYYCINICLTIALFAIGTIYLRYRDRRDHQRREWRQLAERIYTDYSKLKSKDIPQKISKDQWVQRARGTMRPEEQWTQRTSGYRGAEEQYEQRNSGHRGPEEQDRRDQQRREWRQLAERIYTDYSKLKGKEIPQKISKVKNTFERIKIHSKVSGLDVLRYMLADKNYRNFASESPQLKALREDLHMIFVPLNICSSLLLLGEVPVYIEEELRLVVEELGNLVEPFLTGEQQRIALKCLKHFGSNTSSNVVTEHAQRSVKELDERIEAIAPYVNSLQFGATAPSVNSFQFLSPNATEFRNDFPDKKDCDYSKCRKFWLNKTMIMQNSHKNLDFLIKLHEDLEYKELQAHCARIFRQNLEELPHESFEQTSDSDSDKAILMKFLHELRLYIHIILSGDQFMMVKRLVEHNVKKLCQRHGEVHPIKAMIQLVCQRFSEDLLTLKTNIEGNPPPHLTDENFFKQLSDLFEKFLRIITGQEV
ncbi:unnamed protein product [Pocillopora meandrina]|uniref:Uncharacterized protein n=1 Tax=Pocillopora meandrina TaxID=46732 RepID=A0AAU9WHZ0_9CNID|nr:unnamed protein product [Pocillopora meandrina]